MIVAAFGLSACLSFALSLLVASLLGPEGFGRYALASAVAAVWGLAAFDWLRLSVTRFASDPGRPDGPAIRATLDRCLVGAGLITAATAAAVGIVVGDALLAAAFVAGGAAGIFEYAGALARAAGADGRYARLMIGRGAASLAAAGLAAALTRDPAAAVAAAALATAAITAAAGWAEFQGRGGVPDTRLIPVFLRYALPVTAAAALFAALPLANRALLAGRAGFAEAGLFGLVGEVCAKLFQNAGAALDAALFQRAVTAERSGAAAEIAARNLAIVVGLLAPAAAGLAAVWPAFETLFLPAAFAGALARPALLTVPAFALFAVALYGIAPLMQLRHRTAPVARAAAAGLGLDALLLLAWPEPDAVAAAAIQLVGFGAAVLILAAEAARVGARLPWRSMVLSVAASAAMALLLWPTRAAGLPPGLLLPVQVAGGAGIYAAVALGLDLAGCRSWLVEALRQRSINRPAKSGGDDAA